MLVFPDAWIIYYAGCSCLFCLGVGLQFRGHRGRFSRALVIAAFTGVLIPAVACLAYRPSPPPPPPPMHPPASLAEMMSTSVNAFAQAAGEGAGEVIARDLGPLIDGVLCVLVVFLVSLLFPIKSLLPKASG